MFIKTGPSIVSTTQKNNKEMYKGYGDDEVQPDEDTNYGGYDEFDFM